MSYVAKKLIIIHVRSQRQTQPTCLDLAAQLLSVDTPPSAHQTLCEWRHNNKKSAWSDTTLYESTLTVSGTYDTVLRDIAERFAPRSVCCRKGRPMLLTDAEYRAVPRDCCRLERLHRRSGRPDDRL